MSWKVEGTYFENCNCDFTCPCTVTSFASPATQERCHVILAYHVERGQVDGVMASLAPLIGKVLGIEQQPIEYRESGHHHHLKIGDDIAIDVEDYTPQGFAEPTKLVGVFHPSNTTVTVARPTSSRIKAFGMEFHNSGKSAFSAPCRWSA